MLYKPKDTFEVKLTKDYWAVINPYTKATVTAITNETKKILDHFSKGSFNKNLYKKYPSLKRTYLDDTVKELVKAELLFDVEHNTIVFEGRKSVDVWMHITNECNLRCRYCFLDKNSERMSEKTAHKIIDSVFRSAEKNKIRKIRIKFSGGEPTLRFTTIKKILQYADKLAAKKKVNIRYCILSNGTALTDKMLSWIEKHKIHVMISLDGVGKYHDNQRRFVDGSGTFKVVDKTIKKLLKRKISLNISTTISNQNIKGLPELVEYFMDNNIRFCLNLYRENDCSKSNIDLEFNDNEIIHYFKKAFKVIEKYLPDRNLLEVLSDRATLNYPHNLVCSVCNNYIVFDHKGNVYKCQMDMKDVISSCDSMDPLDDVRKSKIGIQNLSVEQRQGCKRCIWRYYCAGGCPILTYRKTGRYDLPSPNCKIYRSILPEIVRLEGLRLLKYGE